MYRYAYINICDPSYIVGIVYGKANRIFYGNAQHVTIS